MAGMTFVPVSVRERGGGGFWSERQGMVVLPRVRLHCATDKAQRVFSVQDGLLAHSVVVYEGRVQR